MKATAEMTISVALLYAENCWPKKMQGEPQERIAALAAHFGDSRIATIGLAEIEAYQTQRRTVRANSQAINEECAALMAVLAEAHLLSSEVEDLYTPFDSVLSISPIYSGESGLDDLGKLKVIEPGTDTQRMILDCCWVILGSAVLWEELRLMRREHVDLKRGTITVPAYRCVPERVMPIRICAEVPDALDALRRLLDSGLRIGADQPQDYLLPFVSNKKLRAYPLKKLWNALRDIAKIGGICWHEHLRYNLRAWALIQWPDLASTAGPGPDEYCCGLAEITANMNDGWKGYYPQPGRIAARMPDTYERGDKGNIFFDDAAIAKSKQWDSLHSKQAQEPNTPARQYHTPADRAQRATPAEIREDLKPEAPATHSLPAAGKLYGAAKEANASIGEATVTIKSLIKKLQKAGLSADVILGIIASDED